MKRIYFTIATLIGVGCFVFSSCSSNRNSNSDTNNKGESTGETVAEEVVVEEAAEPEVHAYGCSHDGITNIHKEASEGSEIIGKLSNGKNHVVVIGKSEEWVEVKIDGQTGYINEKFLSDTPSKPVTVDVDAKWLEGVWSDSGFQYVLLFADGRQCIEHKYSTLNYGKWHLEGNEIILTMLADVDTGLDLSYPIGTMLRYTINKDEETLGNGSGYEMYKWDLEDEIEEGEGGISKSEFMALQKTTKDIVK
jgi:hypothetical protein